MDFYNAQPRSTQQSLLIAILLACACVAIAWVGPKWINFLEPDSGGYINFSPARSAFYPLYLKFMTDLGLSLEQIPTTHLILNALSLIFLFHTLIRLNLPMWLVLVFACAVMFNVYYNAYHFSILTESLTFSLQNILIGLTLAYVYTKSVGLILAIGLVVGLLCGIKPAMFAIVPAFFIIFMLSTWGRGKSMLAHVMVFTLMLVSMVHLEKAIHSAFHEERQSLLPITLYGKAAILSIDPDFKAPQFNRPEEQRVFDLTVEAMQPIKQWLAKESNPFLAVVYTADYEVFSQNSLWPWVQKSYPEADLDNALRESIGKAVILNNIGLYLKLSLTHYIGLWSVHVKHVFSDIFTQVQDAPYIADIWDTGFDDSKVPLSLIVFPAFLALGVFTMVLTLIAFGIVVTQCRKWQPSVFKSDTLQIISLLLIIQANLVATALVNISTPRYLMVTYPHSVLVALMVFNLLLCKFVYRQRIPQASWSH